MIAKYSLSVGCWVKKGSEYLLQKRSSADDMGASKWLIPGGKVEAGETVIQALQRELLEEVGIQIDLTSVRLIKDYLFEKADGQKIVLIFEADWLSGEATALESGTEIKWVDLVNLDTMDYAFTTSLTEVKLLLSYVS
jgi:8-oxo-dGTP diphosphatase